MKRNEMMKQSKKVLSAVIAASVIVGSAVPEVAFAADFSDVEVSVEADEELKTEIQESTESEVELESADAETDLAAVGTELSGFNDEGADFNDGVNADVSETTQEIQNRINALPAVEEFKSMTDGEIAEDNTLSQKQMDVYNEVQAIIEAYENLSEEEQGRVDIGKLKILCEYFNGQTAPALAIEPSMVKASGLILYGSSVKSVDVGLQWPNYAGVDMSIVVLDNDIGRNDLVGRYDRLLDNI